MNVDELADAVPYFQDANTEDVELSRVPFPQSLIRRRQFSVSSISSLNGDCEVPSVGSQNFEIGESSKRKSSSSSTKETNRKQKQKVEGLKIKDNQLPPKKR